MKKYRALPLVLIVVTLLSACGKPEPTATISIGEYEKLEFGWSYDEVKDMVGGKELNKYKGKKGTEYEFKGGEYSVILLFNNKSGRLVCKGNGQDMECEE
ncbi:hypothetical protein [Bacillus sp. CECT 9360]|uniref:hypothetical protein n=1 Tax=Bacillus sp. CECT 9360 TaxID=2845821 RepID=UPI001E58AF30|nr:hypothetical protein [Bacillus sp. CECT 9360]CAH0346550.1 hypothetical protein BCI9360_02889 [Bacillus sp. CECT 9360]